MYTHSSLPLLKSEVSNFIDFINNLHNLHSPSHLSPPENLIQLVQIGQEICILSNSISLPHIHPSLFPRKFRYNWSENHTFSNDLYSEGTGMLEIFNN